MGAQGAQGQAGATGPQGPVGPAGAPKRVERYTATTNASGVATYSWTACTATPDVDTIIGWTAGSPSQMIVGTVASQTLSGATVNVKISQGTLALSASPFTVAPLGTSLTIRVIC